MTVFEDRRDAGRRLAAAVRDLPALSDDARVVVLAIPRGGLPVGAEVARALGADFDVVVVRKLRSPNNPELGFG
ncbi:MAG: phosphoribosyltransferase, partial [Nitriliruptorales bacterium]|nr:phosphoribosyltransferase [Nitriliruptorales bacterium]